MVLTSTKLILGICIISSLFSCMEVVEEKIIYTETFDLDDLIESQEADVADDEFIQKFSVYLKNTSELYNFKNPELVDTIFTLNSESVDLYQSMEYEFEFTTNGSEYYILNNLSEFNDIDDIETGWNLGETAYWAEVLSNTVRKDHFTEYRSKSINAIGDYSEYSEVPVGRDLMVMLHIRWGNLIMHYNQIVHPDMKDQLIERIHDNFNKIKTASLSDIATSD
ncbi:MAG: hypothetical protein ACI837_001489 [Crocinitomicaceae bacterium]|jgi:hypothetical protein